MLFKFAGSPVFESDGCSGYFSAIWKRVHGSLPPWEGRCRVHDGFYWCGGNIHDAVTALGGEDRVFEDASLTRREADGILFDGIAQHSRFWAWASWLAVRVGGSQYLPFSWRWRFRDSYWSVLKEVMS